MKDVICPHCDHVMKLVAYGMVWCEECGTFWKIWQQEIFVPKVAEGVAHASVPVQRMRSDTE